MIDERTRDTMHTNNHILPLDSLSLSNQLSLCFLVPSQYIIINHNFLTHRIDICRLIRPIGLDHPAYFVADIAANHDGDLSRAVDLIYKAAEAGTDAKISEL